MTDSADIKMAQQRLQSALKSLEGSLSPLLDRVSRLESQIQQAGNFSEDRAKLAAELDTVKTQAAEATTRLRAREQDFGTLADETTQELDRVIEQVRAALGQES